MCGKRKQIFAAIFPSKIFFCLRQKNDIVFSYIRIFFRFIYLALNQTESTKKAPLSSSSQVLVVQDDLTAITKGFIRNKPEQMWVKGPPNKEGFFPLRNPYSGKLLTGTNKNKLIVKPGVYFDGKKFHFSGALPRGAKVRVKWLLATSKF